MFILRQITEDGQISNMTLGDRYSLIRKESNPERFSDSIGLADTHPDQEKIFALLSNEDILYPLYQGFHYYVMTERGKTFEAIN